MLTVSENLEADRRFELPQKKGAFEDCWNPVVSDGIKLLDATSTVDPVSTNPSCSLGEEMAICPSSMDSTIWLRSNPASDNISARFGLARSAVIVSSVSLLY